MLVVVACSYLLWELATVFVAPVRQLRGSASARQAGKEEFPMSTVGKPAKQKENLGLLGEKDYEMVTPDKYDPKKRDANNNPQRIWVQPILDEGGPGLAANRWNGFSTGASNQFDAWLPTDGMTLDDLWLKLSEWQSVSIGIVIFTLGMMIESLRFNPDYLYW